MDTFLTVKEDITLLAVFGGGDLNLKTGERLKVSNLQDSPDKDEYGKVVPSKMVWVEKSGTRIMMERAIFCEG